MKVIVTANAKGGVGKSTITCNLAVAAAKDGKKVLIVDADPQQSSMAFRTLREDNNINATSLTKATIHKDITGFDNFDIVFVDVGGKNSDTLRSAILSANQGILLIPLQPSDLDFWGTEDTFQILNEARAFADIKAYAVLNQVLSNRQIKITDETLKSLNEIAPDSNIKILDSMLYSRIAYKKSIGVGKGVIEYEPKGKAANEILDLYKEIKRLL
jgi:chromosome partitioning protein